MNSIKNYDSADVECFRSFVVKKKIKINPSIPSLLYIQNIKLIFVGVLICVSQRNTGGIRIFLSLCRNIFVFSIEKYEKEFDSKRKYNILLKIADHSHIYLIQIA